MHKVVFEKKQLVDRIDALQAEADTKPEKEPTRVAGLEPIKLDSLLLKSEAASCDLISEQKSQASPQGLVNHGIAAAMERRRVQQAQVTESLHGSSEYESEDESD